MPKLVLIIDDDPAQRRMLAEIVRRLGYATRAVHGGAEALQVLGGPDQGAVALVLLDLAMPGMDGMEVLRRIAPTSGGPPVIVQTANGSLDVAKAAMRAGAVDFLVKPTSAERLEISIRSALKIEALQGEISRIKRKAEGTLTFADLVLRAGAMQRVVALGRRAAASNIPVLIEGESGVGKELIARAIQGESERRSRPFVVVNCGAIPEKLVESILFGHEKGSFTGAVDRRIGKFQEADGGTLFLDEIGELPLDAQVKLLRALHDGEIDPVGAKKPIRVNFRLISATNRDMIQLVKEGKFREDLYYRLNVFPISVPPLRERFDDIPELARHFLARFAAEEGRRVTTVGAQALDLLRRYTWPGNVRQLENTMFRAVVLSDGYELGVHEFPQIAAQVDGFSTALTAAAGRPAPPVMLGAERTVPQTIALANGVLGIQAITDQGEIRPLEAMEADMIRLALGRYRGHMTEVAKRLGIGRSTLYRKMREFGLAPRPT
jgi:DNA-binding NtrC family response regulator